MRLQNIQPTPAAIKAAEEWNEQHPVGSQITTEQGVGTVRSPAQPDCGTQAGIIVTVELESETAGYWVVLNVFS